MSDLLRVYDEIRATGLGHQRALLVIARRIGVDTRTVQRVLDRATRDKPSVSALPCRPSSSDGREFGSAAAALRPLHTSRKGG